LVFVLPDVQERAELSEHVGSRVDGDHWDTGSLGFADSDGKRGRVWKRDDEAGGFGRDGGINQLIHSRDVGGVRSLVGHGYAQLAAGCLSAVLYDRPEWVRGMPVGDHDEPQ
jgi:hypothetical protein